MASPDIWNTDTACPIVVRACKTVISPQMPEQHGVKKYKKNGRQREREIERERERVHMSVYCRFDNRHCHSRALGSTDAD